MKSFIDKIFKKRKPDAEQIEENKEILSEQIEASIKERIDQNRINMEEVEKEIYKKPGQRASYKLWSNQYNLVRFFISW
jgi:hypothetical protein